jgi:hypothetical protein
MIKAVGESTLGRRQFLGILGAGASIAATARISTVAVADSETSDEKRKSRYRESEHIRKFFRANRYPT